MSSLVTCAAPVNFENNNENNNNNKTVGTQRKNQTYKNKDNVKKIKKEHIEHIYADSDDESSPLADFSPVQSYLQKQHLTNQNNSNIENNENRNSTSINSNDDSPVKNSEAFTQLDSKYSEDYYKQYKYPENQTLQGNTENLYQGSYVASKPSSDTQTELLKKLDNILYLLEDQHEDKTNLITEELILYVFLGVFVIYVLDSFVRIGKYVR